MRFSTIILPPIFRPFFWTALSSYLHSWQSIAFLLAIGEFFLKEYSFWLWTPVCVRSNIKICSFIIFKTQGRDAWSYVGNVVSLQFIKGSCKYKTSQKGRRAPLKRPRLIWRATQVLWKRQDGSIISTTSVRRPIINYCFVSKKTAVQECISACQALWHDSDQSGSSPKWRVRPRNIISVPRPAGHRVWYVLFPGEAHYLHAWSSGTCALDLKRNIRSSKYTCDMSRASHL